MKFLFAFIVVQVLGDSDDSVCTSHAGDKETCLTAGKCMFLELESSSRCLPCEISGSALPCPPVESVYSMQKVKQCTMQCAHQQIVTKVSPCEDTSGDITLAQCFARGTSAVTKCMWTQFNDAGTLKGTCGPCSVGGVGRIPCVTAGMPGPFAGSVSTLCMSQCADDADCPPMLPGCSNPTAAPPPPVPMAMKPEDLKIAVSDDAPEYYVAKVPPPYGIKEMENAARLAAQAAGWGPDTKQPPSVPFSIYGPPPTKANNAIAPTLPPDQPIIYGPAPPGMIGVPPPGYGLGTAPPPEMVEESKKQSLLAVARKLRAAKLKVHPA